MSDDGYFKLPRRLMRSKLSPERKLALVWLVAQASFTERVVGGVTLAVGETPPLSLSALEIEWRWSRKAVRLFMEYVLSPEAAAETGVRIRVGKKCQGHSEGHSQGHTYLVGLRKVKEAEGHSEGHSQGHSDKKEGKNTSTNPPVVPPTGGSQRGRAKRVPALMTSDWQPNEANRTRAAEWRLCLPLLLDDFRDYWIRKEARRADWDSSFRNRMIFCVGKGLFSLNGKYPVEDDGSVPLAFDRAG